MPIYQTRCPVCGTEKEVMCKYEELQFQVCPTCDVIMEKLVSAPKAVTFNGTGYYQTDFKNKQYERG